MKPTRMNADQQPLPLAAKLLERDLTGTIIGCFYRVYNDLGFGFLESVYRRAMYYELAKRRLNVDAEAPIDVWYQCQKVGHFRADLLVEGRVIVEIKCSQTLAASDRRQLVNYLRATELEVGLLLHFGPKAAYERVVCSREFNRGKIASDNDGSSA